MIRSYSYSTGCSENEFSKVNRMIMSVFRCHDLHDFYLIFSVSITCLAKALCGTSQASIYHDARILLNFLYYLTICWYSKYEIQYNKTSENTIWLLWRIFMVLLNWIMYKPTWLDEVSKTESLDIVLLQVLLIFFVKSPKRQKLILKCCLKRSNFTII